MACYKDYYKGKVVPSPSPSHGESCESMYASGLFVHQKCSNYVLTNLLFGLYKLICIIDTRVIHLNPHSGILARPFYPKNVTN
jgi:hypothetical protein